VATPTCVDYFLWQEEASFAIINVDGGLQSVLTPLQMEPKRVTYDYGNLNKVTYIFEKEMEGLETSMNGDSSMTHTMVRIWR